MNLRESSYCFIDKGVIDKGVSNIHQTYKLNFGVIADVTQLDSGNYTCEIRGPYSAVLGQTTHYLFVRGL